MGNVLRYLFDLTTSAHWGGAPVGIVRVERELASRARAYLGDELAFSLYDRSRKLVLTIDDKTAADIISGRRQIDFTPIAPPPVAPWTPALQYLNAQRRRVRRALRTNATLYHAFQTLRGRSFTREEILRIRAEEFATDADAIVPAGALPISKVAHREARLDAETMIISGGLDWEFKDMRSLWALKQEHRFRYCTIVHDIIPILFPHFVVPSLVDILSDYFGELVWLADHAMCNSRATERDWLRYCGELGIETMRSNVFPLGSDLPVEGVEPEIALPETLQGKRFALFVSTIEPRKNHRTLYEAWDHCVRSGMIDRDRDRLVFVGRHGWATGDLLHEISSNPATAETLVVLNHVSDDLLRGLYRACSLVLFPSHYEGYGLPVAEALAYAKPCVTSNAGSLPEIGGDLVVRLDPKDTIGWADTMAHYLSAPDELESWHKRIKDTYKPVSWDSAAERFFGTVKTLKY